MYISLFRFISSPSGPSVPSTPSHTLSLTWPRHLGPEKAQEQSVPVAGAWGPGHWGAAAGTGPRGRAVGEVSAPPRWCNASLRSEHHGLQTPPPRQCCVSCTRPPRKPSLYDARGLTVQVTDFIYVVITTLLCFTNLNFYG